MNIATGNQVLTVLGMMSGTSLDGVDAAILRTDGEGVAEPGARLFQPYDRQEREVLRAALAAAPLAAADIPPPAFAAAAAVVDAAHLRAIEALLDQARLARREIDLVGFHGQTVFHAPERRITIQLGDGEALARAAGIDVVWDFRSADIAAGGQGAPLVPAYHRALAVAAGLEPPLALVNIGGVANITWIGKDGELIAFDTGPGNALIDDLVAARAGMRMDEDGRLAAAGHVDDAVLARLLAESFFEKRPPKSLDRNDFSIEPVAGLGLEDAAATLAAFTAEALARAARHLPRPPRRWIVCGGGARNPVILRQLAARVPAPATVETAGDHGWREEFVEAEAFAYLAARSLRGLPLTFPGTTGVEKPVLGGRLAMARPGEGARSASA